MDSSYLGYYGPKWDKTIQDKNHPNFWKFGVSNLVFLDTVRKKRKILDVGCGTGRLAFFIAENSEVEHIVGIDPVKSMIEVAKRNAFVRKMNRKIDFFTCDGRQLPFKPSYFDALVSRGDSFTFLVPLEKTLSEFRRVLKKGAAVAVEIDNVRWKPGRTVSSGFQKMAGHAISYFVENFDSKRNHTKTFYVLDPKGRIAKRVCRNGEFVHTGRLEREVPLARIRRETVEIRRSAMTRWPTADKMKILFEKEGFHNVEVLGNGLLMGLLLEGRQNITKAMKRQPELFFEIERRLIPFINPKKAHTIILKATVR